MVGNVKCLIDVIGMVTSYGLLEKRSEGAQKMDVMLADARNDKMVVTLWEQKTFQFQESKAEGKGAAMFVVITGLIAKRFSDRVTLSSTDATRTYLNIDYPPLNDLKGTMSTINGKAIQTLPPPTVTQFISVEADHQKELSTKDILDLKIPPGKENVRAVCKAKIVAVLPGNGWFYNCCPKCARSVRILEDKYYCNGCAEEANPLAQRYTIVVQVEDKTGTITFTLFNKEAEQIVGVPLQKILADLKETDLQTHIPPPVKNIVGNICAFQIKVTPYNITHGCEEYTVTRISECTSDDNTTNGEGHFANITKR